MSTLEIFKLPMNDVTESCSGKRLIYSTCKTDEWILMLQKTKSLFLVLVP